MTAIQKQQCARRRELMDLVMFGKVLATWVVFVAFVWILLYACLVGKEFPDMVWIVVSNWKS